jgi:aminoglycoside phosphotransferase (APT) family kinase protein
MDCAQLYAANTGRDISDLLFYYVFGLFKNAVIVQQIYFRWKKGLHNDDRFGALINLIKLLGKHAVRTLEKNSIS